MDSHKARKRERKGNTSAAKRARQTQPVDQQNLQLGSGVTLCLSALDHCSEQVSSINDAHVLTLMISKAAALQQAAQQQMAQLKAADDQADARTTPKQQQKQEQQSGNQAHNIGQTQLTRKPTSKHERAAALQGQAVDIQPLQVIEDKKPCKFKRRAAAAGAVPGQAAAIHLEQAQPHPELPQHNQEGKQLQAHKQVRQHNKHLHQPKAPKDQLHLTQDVLAVHKQRSPQMQQQSPPDSAARAVLRSYVQAAQAGRVYAAACEVGDSEQVDKGTKASEKQAPTGSISSTVDKGSNSNSTSSSSDASSSSDDSSSTTSSSSCNSDTSNDTSSNTSSSSEASGSAPCSAGDYNALSKPTAMDGPLHTVGTAVGQQKSQQEAQVQQQQPQEPSQDLCLVCKRMVAVSPFKNKLTAACGACVLGASVGVCARLSHCPKRGCGQADVKLGPRGMHQGLTGRQHFITAAPTKGFSVHYTKPKRGGKAKRARSPASKRAGGYSAVAQRTVLGSPKKKAAKNPR